MFKKTRSHSLIYLLAFFVLMSFSMGQDQEKVTDSQIFQTMRWRNIGPSNMMGRISALDALDTDWRVVLVGSASGGVFKSTNAGATWIPIFDKYGSGSIGDVAFFQADPEIIWVGTGEANNRNSSGWGDGIYKSIDGGKTFTNMGLQETHQIARLATHPTDSDILYVAAVGHLWGYSGTRGLYKTTDGGKTWQKLTNGLPTDEKTGCTEIKMHPDNPDILFCAMYHRLRKPWTFYSGGDTGGIFKSEDAGKTWRRLADGLPEGEIGRVGIDIYRSDPRIVVASVEASDKLPDDLNIPGPGVYRSDDGGESWKYLLRHTSRPMYHGRIAINPQDENLIYVIARIFRFSADGGKTFGGKPWRGAGGDDHDLWISPQDKNVFYTASDQGAHLTVDGGKSFISFNNMAIAQYYAIGVDMRDPYWVYGGMQDIGGFGGPSNSRDRQGILIDHNIEVNGGDGFHMQVDPTDWRTVYTVCHVGGIGRINMETRETKLISPRPENIINFKDVYDPKFPEKPIAYTIYPGEHWLWRAQSRSSYSNILPPQFRFNWSSPLIISPQNPRTIYVGGNYLFKSVDRGDSWRIISPDLTTNDPKKRNSSESGGLTMEVTGAENHCTIISVSESPMNDSVIWTGADDGSVHVTRNGGADWADARKNVKGVPEGIWCSRVEASHFNEGTAYVTFDGHRSDDFKPYVFKTVDYGTTWTDISGNLPDGQSLYVLKEDFKNPDLLFVGSEFACFTTINGGTSWFRLDNNMPTVAFHDLVIHPREADLVAGTHGRSIWILDDITPLQQLTPDVIREDAYLFENRVATRWQNISLGRQQTFFKFRGENPPRGAFINFWLKSAPQGKVKITIEDPLGRYRSEMSITGKAGVNQANWNMRFPVLEKDLLKFKELLGRNMAKLMGMVKTDAEKKEVVKLRESVRNESSERGLGSIHRQLTRNYSAYSQGFDLFGPGLQQSEAVAGEYKITLTVDGKTLAGKLQIRNDPLLDK
ncbi:WD40/YVTN/BNR-like repeat-containing protein [Acidobacteriota bacterium]